MTGECKSLFNDVPREDLEAALDLLRWKPGDAECKCWCGYRNYPDTDKDWHDNECQDVRRLLRV